jgi:hypothetical protein
MSNQQGKTVETVVEFNWFDTKLTKRQITKIDI